jgi:hypothetical protein
MADTDTGWFAVPSARSRRFGHSGKIRSIVSCFNDMTSLLNNCAGLIMFWFLSSLCGGLFGGRWWALPVCLVKGLSIALSKQVACVSARPCLLK